MTNLKDKVQGVTLSKTIQVSPDEDSKKAGIHKTIILKVKYDELTLEDVFLKALDKDVVSWQNGSGGRKNYVNLVDKSTIVVNAKSPGKAPEIDPMDKFLMEARAAGVDVEDKVAMSEYIMKRLGK